MEPHAKTIQIFLPDGDPRGIRIAEITSRVVRVLMIPRTRLQDALARRELKQVGLYFLFGDEDADVKPTAYIGETENLGERLLQHNKEKDFWTVATAVVTNNQMLTKSHVKFLESLCFEIATNSGRFKLEQTVPNRPHVTESTKADLLDLLETIKLLISALGYPVLDEKRSSTPSQAMELFYCQNKGIKAVGELTVEGLVVYKDSQMVKDVTKSLTSYTTLRQRLINEGIVKLEGEYYVFQSDQVFSSPSAASTVILGTATNGWDYWKDHNGKTLGDLKR